ncbi:MAG: hypothetical protein GVY36_16545 [Verrucomicrobia bacterium]|jgi:hypothetical protein|nr:hypothetical protein [Verrucomicrobiota bacterium]
MSGDSDRPLSFTTIENPFQALSESERQEITSALSTETRARAGEILDNLDAALRSFHPFQIIAQVTAYGLTVTATKDGIQRPEDGYENYQPVTELLQALALKIPPHSLGSDPIPPQTFSELFEEVKELTTLLQLKTIYGDQPPDGSENVHLKGLQKLTKGYRSHVRNWGYYGQVRNICEELYTGFDATVQEQRGYKVSDVLTLFSELTKRNDDFLSHRMEKLSEVYKAPTKEEMVRTYYAEFGLDSEDIQTFIERSGIESIDRSHLLALLCSHSDLFLFGGFTHNIEGLSSDLGMSSKAVSKICVDFGYGLGDLADSDSEHSVLENPIWQRPIVNLGESLFCALPQVFFSFAIPALEQVIEECDAPRLFKHRSNYLESKIEQLARRHFAESEATIVPNFEWVQGDDRYESDLVLQLDSTVLIIEAKSQRISPSALRGAPDRMKRHVREIVVEPSKQSRRLELAIQEAMREATGEGQLNDRGLNLSAVRKIIRISVTLEDFAVVHGCLYMLEDAGWVPSDYSPCPTMTLADFETVLDLLDNPLHILNYFRRRSDLVTKVRLQGDEIDFLGLYLRTLLNIERQIPSDHNFVVLPEMSSKIDNFYESADHGIHIKKPVPEMAACYRRIISQVAERQRPGWTELGMVLLRLAPEEQREFCRQTGIFSRIVEQNWRRRHKNIVICRPASANEVVLAMVLYKDKNSEKRDEFIDSALSYAFSEQGSAVCVVMARNIDDDELPFHFIALTYPSNETQP